MFGKTLYAIDDGNRVYYPDGTVGKRKLLTNYTFIKVIKENPTCSKSKPAFAKYLLKIKTEDGIRYCYSNHLTTPYLKLILKNLYPNENIFFVKVSPHLGILFFDKEYIIVGRNEEELKGKIESILQGLSYKEVNIDFLVKKVSSVDLKRIFKYTTIGLTSLITLLVLGGVGYYFLSKNNEEQKQTVNLAQNIIKPVRTIVKNNELPYEESLYFLNEVLKLNLGNYLFIKNLDFANDAITLASFIPLPSFKQNGNMYVYTAVLKKQVKKALDKIHSQRSNYKLQIVLHNYAKCLNFLKKYPLREMTSNYITFEVRKLTNPDEVYKFLKILSNCPVKLQGRVDFEDLFHRRVSLIIYLYTPQYTLSLLQ